MRVFTKLGCLAVCLAIAVGVFCSCDIINGAQGGNIDPDKYVAEVRVVFATNDDKMKDSVGAIGSSSVINVDGDNASVRTVAEIGGSSIDNGYILVDGMLYNRLFIASDSLSAESLKKAAVTDMDKISILSEVGTGADIGLDDFNSCETYDQGGIDVYSCSDITDEARASLAGAIAPRFSALGGSVMITDARYTLEMDGDIEVGSTLSCSFEITLDGVTYGITMHTYTEYDYSAAPSVCAPENAADYTVVAAEDILN